MRRNDLFYIDGRWVQSDTGETCSVLHPATGAIVATIALGSRSDIDHAVQAARRAFDRYADTSVEERIALFDRIVTAYDRRWDDLAEAMTLEMGTPITFSREIQTKMGLSHLEEMRRVLVEYPFERDRKGSTIRREPIGVCGLITPWNWPINQITSKLAPALAAGCTMVVKPSEFAPVSPMILMEILHEAGVPPGVVNLVNGTGEIVGDAISRHPGIDMVSFTGSTRAGILVAQAAAPTVKRVTQELGGKSANILLPDADLDRAVPAGVLRCYFNAGQSCQAPTRMIAPRSQRDTVVRLAAQAAASVVVGDPFDPKTTMGPLANAAQYERVQALIESGLEEGATLVAGGLGRPDGLEGGSYVRPTVFADVGPSMSIARKEIFGPVLVIQFYDELEEAIDLANDSEYGLAGYVQSRDAAAARRVAKRLRAGRIYLNGATATPDVPFGGYKQSGNGREQGVFGLEEYLEVKAIVA